MRLFRILLNFCWCLGEKITLKWKRVYILWRKDYKKMFTRIREQQEQGSSLRRDVSDFEGNHHADWAKTSPRECSPTMSGRPAEQGGEESLSCQCVPLTIRQNPVTGQVPPLIPYSSSGAGLGQTWLGQLIQVLTGEMGLLSPRAWGGCPRWDWTGSLLPKGSDNEHLY